MLCFYIIYDVCLQVPSALPYDYYGRQTVDNKFGKADLGYLKNRLETQTVVQFGHAGSHPQLTSPYANYKVPPQGIPESTAKPIPGKPLLSSLRANLETFKEERKKKVVGNEHKHPDYGVFTYVQENPVMIHNPPINLSRQFYNNDEESISSKEMRNSERQGLQKSPKQQDVQEHVHQHLEQQSYQEAVAQFRQQVVHTEYQRPMMPMEQQSYSDYRPPLQSYKVP